MEESESEIMLAFGIFLVWLLCWILIAGLMIAFVYFGHGFQIAFAGGTLTLVVVVVLDWRKE